MSDTLTTVSSNPPTVNQIVTLNQQDIVETIARKTLAKQQKEQKKQQKEKKDLLIFEDIQPWDSVVDGMELLNQIKSVLNSNIEYQHQDDYSTVVSLWILHTYCYKLFDYSPILWLHSPTKGCGKTRHCELIRLLANRSFKSENSTAAALYRLVERYGVTLITDEFDMMDTDTKSAILGIYNTGIEPNGQRVYCDNNNEVVVSHTFCPKVISGLNNLLSTTKSRSIVVRLQKALKSRFQRINKHDPMWNDIKRKCVRWVNQHSSDIQSFNYDTIGGDKLDGRHFDIWAPLLILSAVVGGTEFKEKVIQIAYKFTDINREVSADYNQHVLIEIGDSLRDWMKDNTDTDRMPLKVILQFINESGIPLNYDKSVDENTIENVRRLLENFGVTTRQRDRLTKKINNIVKFDALLNILNRYAPEKESII